MLSECDNAAVTLEERYGDDFPVLELYGVEPLAETVTSSVCCIECLEENANCLILCDLADAQFGQHIAYIDGKREIWPATQSQLLKGCNCSS
ncbi:hypothetical protein MHYP_G00333460 [Metynnis hypsauchen]